LQEDLDFLQEIYEELQSVCLKPDVTRIEKVIKMVEDWIDQLEEIKAEGV